MSELEIQGIPVVRFGIDAVSEIAELISPHGRRVLLVTEQTGKPDDNFHRVLGFLRAGGLDPVIFDDIRPGIKSSVIQTIADIGKAGKVQVVLGLGGMRVLSLARLATVMIGSDASLHDILQGRIPSRVDCSYIELPNSCRNHFMMKNACILPDSVSERARYITLPQGMTRAVLVDPVLSSGLSRKYQLVAILDTMLASVEGFLSKKRNFVSDVLLLEAVSKLKSAMLQTLRRPDDLSVRQLASEGGLLSGMGLASSSQGLGGTLAYMINAAFAVPKSWIAMVLLPHILEIYAEKEPERTRRIADALGEDGSILQSEQAAKLAPQAARRFLAQLELPTRLRDFNLSLDELSTICEAAAEFPLNRDCGLGFSAGEICDLIKKAF